MKRKNENLFFNEFNLNFKISLDFIEVDQTRQVISKFMSAQCYCTGRA